MQPAPNTANEGKQSTPPPKPGKATNRKRAAPSALKPAAKKRGRRYEPQAKSTISIPDNLIWPSVLKGVHFGPKGAQVKAGFDDCMMPYEDCDAKGMHLKVLTDAKVAGLPTLDEIRQEMEEEIGKQDVRSGWFHACPFCPYRTSKTGISNAVNKHAFENKRKNGVSMQYL